MECDYDDDMSGFAHPDEVVGEKVSDTDNDDESMCFIVGTPKMH